MKIENLKLEDNVNVTTEERLTILIRVADELFPGGPAEISLERHEVAVLRAVIKDFLQRNGIELVLEEVELEE